MARIFKQKSFTFKTVDENGKIKKVVLPSSYLEAMAIASRRFQDEITKRTRPASHWHLQQRMEV